MFRSYPESAQEAAQIARQTIPFVTNLDLAANPINYAVFYEYFSGTNAPLRNAADEIAARLGTMDQEQVAELYYRYVAKENPEFVAKVQGELRSLIATLADALGATGLNNQQYEARLRVGLESLEGQATSVVLHELIGSLIEDTKLVVKSNARLNKRIETANHDLQMLQQQLEHQRTVALADPLTGLANRRAFDTFLANATSQAASEGQPLCLAMIDVDHFKSVNDTHGHVIGDYVLRFIAEAAREAVRGEDLVARYGGEEFAVVLVNTPPEGAAYVAEKIRARISSRALKHTSTGASIGNVTVSLGVATYRSGETADQFIQRADRGLYTAKQQGRNRVVAMAE